MKSELVTQFLLIEHLDIFDNSHTSLTSENCTV